MAIRINITANVSNIKQIKTNIEKQLQGLKLSIGNIKGIDNLNALMGTKGGATGGAAKGFQATSQGVSELINHYKALDLERKDFIEKSKSLIDTLKREGTFLSSRATLTQKLLREEKIAAKEKIDMVKLQLQFSKQLQTQATVKTKAAEYKRESDALRQLIKDGRTGKIATDELKKAGDALVTSLNNQKAALQQLDGKTKVMTSTRRELKTNIADTIKWYKAEEQAIVKARSVDFSANIKKQVAAQKELYKEVQNTKKERSKDFSSNLKKQLAAQKALLDALRAEAKARDKISKDQIKAARAYEDKQIKASFSEQQKTAAAAVKNVVTQYEQGVLTLNGFILKARELKQEYRDQANVTKELTTLQKALDRAATNYWMNVEKGAAIQKQAAIEAKAAAKAENLVIRESQKIRAVLNRLKRETTGQAEKKDIINIKTYNDAILKQIALYKARKISAEEFLKTTQRLKDQEQNYARVSDQTASKLASSQNQAWQEVKKTSKAMGGLNQSLNQQKGNLASTNKGLKGFINNLGMIIKKFADWILVANIVYLPIRAFQSAITYIIEMDDALTDLNKVVELSTSQLDDMRLSAIQLGKELGVSSSEIMRGMAEFGRITKLKEEIKSLAEAAAVAANVTTMSADDAAKAINTTLITFKKDVSEAMSIIDAFNEIQNNFRTSAEDLADSVGKVGAAARQAGIEMEDLAGYTTAIVSATGVSGNIAGTAFFNGGMVA